VLPYIDASQSGVVSLAYSYGKAVVVTSVGELQGLVDDGITGLVVAPRDAGAIADAVVSLLLDADLRHELGRRGTAKMNEECGPGVVGDIHLEIYRRAIREHLTPKR
jgi:glycosyltransferase involved in cell wall biosynthesis